jgi:hypothetical protein
MFEFLALPLACLVLGIIVSTSWSNPLLAVNQGEIHDTGDIDKHEFDINNLKVETFGITDQHAPFLALNGSYRVGGSIPSNSEQLFAYLFYTSEGIFAVSFSEDKSTYTTSQITLDAANCIISSVELESADIRGNILKLSEVGPRLSSIDKVQTSQFNIDDDATCIVKVFDSPDKP